MAVWMDGSGRGFLLIFALVGMFLSVTFFFQDLLRLFISFPVSHEICKWEIGMYRYHQYHIPRDGSTSWGGS